jgi:hypothetical protein
MIALTNGSYLGKIEKMVNANGIILSITSYPNARHSESKHYHETENMSFVLSGGNLEKRYFGDVERLPGITTMYSAENFITA